MMKINNIRKNILSIIIFIMLIIPLIYSFTLFNGFAGQIKPTDYPKDWYEINNFLDDDKNDFKVLFLPWHQYMKFKWLNNTNKMILNPSQSFFDKETITATNIENRLIYREDKSPEQLYIDFLLSNRKNITNFGELLSILNIKYIILAKEQDYKRYEFLFNQSDLEVIKDTRTLYLFKSKKNVSKIYSVDGVTYIKDWKELLEKSRNDDITNRLYIIDNNLNNTPESGSSIIEYGKESPVDYNLKSSNKKYVIFTEPYSEDWQLDSKKPLKAYGVVNAYIADKNNMEIKFERFYQIYLPSYSISLLTFISLVGVYLGKFFQ